VLMMDFMSDLYRVFRALILKAKEVASILTKLGFWLSSSAAFHIFSLGKYI
jgi:hypothetical protein